VDVHVPEPGQHGHAFGGDHLGAARNSQRPDLTNGGDALSIDDDDAVAKGSAAESIDERAGDESLHTAWCWLTLSRRCGLGGGNERDQAQEERLAHATL
jgi:hypothetical protein